MNILGAEGNQVGWLLLPLLLYTADIILLARSSSLALWILASLLLFYEQSGLTVGFTKSEWMPGFGVPRELHGEKFDILGLGIKALLIL